VKLTNLGLALSILGALLIAISQAGTVVLLMTGCIIAALRACRLSPRLRARMDFSGDPLLRLDPIYRYITDQKAQDRLVAHASLYNASHQGTL
jgi:hypothetical protein